MRIETVQAFYFSMPKVKDIADGSQDMLLVKVSADGYSGWGECEASPLVSIASLVCPMSHSACRPVLDSVLGQAINSGTDIFRVSRMVRANSLDLLQAAHTLSGIEIALWDLLGKVRQQPVYELLGFKTSGAKTPYASALFGDDPQTTLQKAKTLRSEGFRAAKFGWGLMAAPAWKRTPSKYSRLERASVMMANSWSTPGRSGSTTSRPLP